MIKHVYSDRDYRARQIEKMPMERMVDKSEFNNPYVWVFALLVAFLLGVAIVS